MLRFLAAAGVFHAERYAFTYRDLEGHRIPDCALGGDHLCVRTLCVSVWQRSADCTDARRSDCLGSGRRRLLVLHRATSPSTLPLPLLFLFFFFFSGLAEPQSHALSERHVPLAPEAAQLSTVHFAESWQG